MLAMATSLVGMAQSLASIWSALTSCPPSSRQARVTRSWAASCSVGVRRSSCGVGLPCSSCLQPLSGRIGASYAVGDLIFVRHIRGMHSSSKSLRSASCIVVVLASSARLPGPRRQHALASISPRVDLIVVR
jgi:hypothetical protein